MKRHKKPYKPMNMAALRTTPIARRRSLVDVKDFARLPLPNDGFRAFERSLPDVLAAKDI